MPAPITYRRELPPLVVRELDLLVPKVTRDILDRVVSTDLQDSLAWTAAPYAAGLFTGSAAMTWTVTQANVVLFKYRKLGKTLHVKLVLKDTVVAGVVSPTLLVTIPASLRALDTDVTGLGAYNDNGAGWVSGARVSTTAGSNQLSIQKANLTTNWTASAGTTEIAFQFEFQLQ